MFEGTLLDPAVFVGERDRWLELIVKTLAVATRHKFGTVPGPLAHGIYFLYMGNRLVYIGKSSGNSVTKSNSIFSRLSVHWEKVQNRVGLYPEQMTYQVIPIEAEYSGNIILIEQYAIQFFKPYLNGTGFGSLPPGHGRRFQKPSRFEEMHPLVKGRQDIYKVEQTTFIRRVSSVRIV